MYIYTKTLVYLFLVSIDYEVSLPKVMWDGGELEFVLVLLFDLTNCVWVREITARRSSACCVLSACHCWHWGAPCCPIFPKWCLHLHTGPWEAPGPWDRASIAALWYHCVCFAYVLHLYQEPERSSARSCAFQCLWIPKTRGYLIFKFAVSSSRESPFCKISGSQGNGTERMAVWGGRGRSQYQAFLLNLGSFPI